jgi:hypothetical protein
MQDFNAEYMRNSALSWALWKALDFLTERYLRPYTNSLAANPAAAATPAANPSAEMVAACQQLADPASPVLKALTAIWAQRGNDEEAGFATLGEQLAQLAPAEGLVVLAVITQALKV